MADGLRAIKIGSQTIQSNRVRSFHFRQLHPANLQSALRRAVHTIQIGDSLVAKPPGLANPATSAAKATEKHRKKSKLSSLTNGQLTAPPVFLISRELTLRRVAVVYGYTTTATLGSASAFIRATAVCCLFI